MRTPILVLAGLLLAGCAADDNRISMHQLEQMQADLAEAEPVTVRQGDLTLADTKPFRAQTGDVLQIVLIGADLDDALKPMQLLARVTREGTVRLPLVGQVTVSGRPLGEIEDAIYAAYVPAMVKSLSVHATVTQANEITVMVSGAAGRRGMVSLPSNKRNLLYALEQADGFTGAASGVVHVQPATTTREAQTYDLNNINDMRRAMSSPPLQSGDTITVEAGEAPAVYLTGLVNTPGPIVLGQNNKLSVMQALAAGSGVLDFLEPKEATLWRRLEDGQRVRVKLALDEIMSGTSPDVALYAGDILDVPHTLETRARQWFVENVRLGPFGVTAVYDPLADRRAKIVSDNNNNGSILQSVFLSGLNSAIPTLIQPSVVAP